MFAKLKESKFFKSFSGILCSIEIVETKNEAHARNHYPQHPASSDSLVKDADKAVHPAP